MENLFVWIVLLPIVAIYGMAIILHFIIAYDPELYLNILFSLRAAYCLEKTEKFFKNQSKAARKLYDCGKQIGAKISITRVNGRYSGVVFFIKRKTYIFFDNSYLYADTNGLLEISLAHELGHCLTRSEPPIEFCGQKKMNCELIREKLAWDAAFALFKELKITIDEEAFWNRARAAFATYVRTFIPKECDAIPKLECSRAFEFFPSPLFKETSDEEIKKYLFEIPETDIIKSD